MKTPESNGKTKWIESAGGPLILLEKTYLRYWRGCLKDKAVTDYDRACAVMDYLGTISVGPGYAVVLGEEPFSTSWWQVNETGAGFLVRWVCADDESAVRRALINVPLTDWEATRSTFEVSIGELTLIDAASLGSDVDDSITICLSPGKYAAETLHYNPNETTSLILHRFVAEVHTD